MITNTIIVINYNKIVIVSCVGLKIWYKHNNTYAYVYIIW